MSPSGRMSSLGVTTTAGRTFGLRPCGSGNSTKTIWPRWGVGTVTTPSVRRRAGHVLFLVPRRRRGVLRRQRFQLGRRQRVIRRGEVFQVFRGPPAIKHAAAEALQVGDGCAQAVAAGKLPPFEG